MNNEYYDLQHIKGISIHDYLTSLGIQPLKRYRTYALYNAPYREDHNASLKVDFARNLWYDFGLCRGGSIIDLAMLLHACDAYEAMSHLAKGDYSFHRVSHQAQAEITKQPTTRRILSISETLPPHLCHYLQEVRKIDLTLALPYLRAISYEINSHTYTAIGFPNSAVGYELRDDKHFKGSIAPKDISVLMGSNEKTNACNLFEGFIDFLSYLTMKEGSIKTSCIVLNSVSNLSRAIDYLKEHRFSLVRAFLDNDDAGRQALHALQSSGVEVEDMSRHYAGHKDLNEWLCAQHKTQKQALPPRRRGLRR